MWNAPTTEQLNDIPKLYETEHKTTLPDKLIHFHFFIGGCDWYIAEYEGQGLFFGFAILNGDYQRTQSGDISHSVS
jgi:hypothetical protein